MGFINHHSHHWGGTTLYSYLSNPGPKILDAPWVSGLLIEMNILYSLYLRNNISIQLKYAIDIDIFEIYIYIHIHIEILYVSQQLNW